MAQLSGSIQWRLDLNTEEFNLVSKALRGVITEEQKTDALDLCNRITKLRATAIREQVRTANRLDHVSGDNVIA